MIATEEQKMIREMTWAFAREKLAPHAAQWDRDHAFPAEARAEMGGLARALETRTAAVGIWLFGSRNRTKSPSSSS